MFISYKQCPRYICNYLKARNPCLIILCSLLKKKYLLSASVNQNNGQSVKLTLFQILFAGQTSNLVHNSDKCPYNQCSETVKDCLYWGTGSCIKLLRLALSVFQYFKFGMKVLPKEKTNHSKLRSRVKLIQPCGERSD